MDFILSWNNNETVLSFPVIPNGGITLSRGQDNQTFEGLNGEMQSLGLPQLAKFELSSIFPTKPYPFIRPGASSDGWAYVNTILLARNRRIPFRAIYIDNSGREVFNLPVSLDSFEYSLDRAGDVAYTMQFTEYRFAGNAALELITPTTPQPTAQTQTQAAAAQGDGYTKRYTQSDAVMMARVMYLEARGIQSKTEIACIGWTILNRVDAKFKPSIAAVITAPNQFAYASNAKTVSDHEYNLVDLATDVLTRWSREKSGQANVGRVLPLGYCWYSGNGSHNYFRNKYKGGTRWGYSLPSPY